MKPKHTQTSLQAAIALALSASAAFAEGELFIYNWGDYTAPALVEKFESETGISVTLDTYDNNETLLAKLQSGAAGYDIVVPSHNFIENFVSEGLLQPINASGLVGYDNIKAEFASPPWDENNVYTIPWVWGTTSFTVNTDIFSGDINSYDVLFNPSDALKGEIGMFKSPDEVISMAQTALGLPLCSEDPEEMSQVLELLQGQKPHVKTYSSEGILERLVSGDVAIHQNWSGYSLRARNENAALKYAFPKEGVITWMDNVAVPKGAPNFDNAIKFIEFLTVPENIAIQSDFTGYANGISGSEAHMSDELKSASELSPPEGTPLVFSKSCSPSAVDLQNRVWTALLQ